MHTYQPLSPPGLPAFRWPAPQTRQWCTLLVDAVPGSRECIVHVAHVSGATCTAVVRERCPTIVCTSNSSHAKNDRRRRGGVDRTSWWCSLVVLYTELAFAKHNYTTCSSRLVQTSIFQGVAELRCIFGLRTNLAHRDWRTWLRYAGHIHVRS